MSGNKDIERNEENYLTLEFDDGAEIECEIMGIFDVNGKEYIALLPDDGTDDVYLYGYKEIGEEEFEIIDIVDDAEFEAVAAEFDRITIEEIIDTEE
ncbi:MAG: DUF1292 domain-containing protein [Firmicutes bacterium]|nr:DUF1292 domain-containing protein [Clostridiales bacterium]MBQ4340616.1 DUF1292 domain-containing protein [Bacillota bacterium]